MKPASGGGNPVPTLRRCLLSLALLLPLAVAAAPASPPDMPLQFADPAEERRYRDLLEELRCLVCQNQSLADSHADLAQDLRREVYEQLRAGESDAAIMAFLARRYGDFVIYRPPVDYRTALLWGGPFLLLLAVGAVLWRALGRQRAAAPPPLTAAERERLRYLLDEEPRG